MKSMTMASFACLSALHISFVDQTQQSTIDPDQASVLSPDELKTLQELEKIIEKVQVARDHEASCCGSLS